MSTLACVLAMAALAAAEPGAAAKAGPAVEPTDPKDLNQAFWTDWKEKAASEQFSAVMKSSGAAARVANSRGDGRKDVQHVADMAITNPKDAAPLLQAASQKGQSPEMRAAMETALVMRTSAQTRAAAVQESPPETRAAARQFAANLSTGIPGLPGVYLGGSQSGPQSGSRNAAQGGSQNEAQSASRPAAPAGYAPVAGGSGGCPG